MQDIWVAGEVSNFSRPTSGHLYFTIKDSACALKCVMWRNAAVRQTFLPRDGDAVEAHGAINIYEAGGQYQLYADLLRPAGEGALYQQFLRLKARLEAEGLFAPQRKRPIPRWPRRIGIVTSPTGAALRDVLNTIQRRYCMAEVILAATPVQGNEAPAGIVSALKDLCQLDPLPDVILVVRGGGSIEDLWAFNDERVARAIFASPAAVISGVGHETDFTIADFVADLRAPTPTAAAELATLNRSDLQVDLTEMHRRLGRAVQGLLSTQRWQLNRLENRLLLHSPTRRIRSDRQRLDDLGRRSQAVTAHNLQIRRLRLDSLHQRLESLNPHEVLQRGYAVVTNAQTQELIRSIQQVVPGMQLNVRVSDGKFSVQAQAIDQKD